MKERILKLFSKRAISIVCAIVLIVVAIPAASFVRASAQVTHAQVVKTIDFDTTSMSVTNSFEGSNNTKYTNFPVSADNLARYPGLNLWSVADDGGNKALKFSYSPDCADKNGGEWGVGLLRLNEDGNLLNLTSGKKYTITFRYKRTGGAETANTDWMVLTNNYSEFTNADGSWGWFKPKTAVNGAAHGSPANKNSFIPETNRSIKYTNNSMGGKDICGNAYVLNEWNTLSYTFTATSQVIALAGPVTVGTSILIDDITIIENNDESVISYTCTDGMKASVCGVPGTAVAAPSAPVGMEFAGWQHAGSASAVTSLSFPAILDGPVGVYTETFAAKSYGNVEDYVTTYDFESGTKTEGPIGALPAASSYQGTSNQIYSIVDDGTGNKVLQAKFPSAYTSQTWLNGAFILNNGTDVCVLTPGETYTVSMRYQIVAPGTNPGNEQWMILGNGIKQGNSTYYGELTTTKDQIGTTVNGANPNKLINKHNYRNISSVKDINGNTLEKGKWQTISITFVAGENDGAPLGLVNSTSISSVMWVDDIAILKSPAVALSFESNGGSNVPTLYGFPGTQITMPADPSKTGSRFSGWYTDKELTKAFDASAGFGSATIKLYAKWTEENLLGSYVFDFDDPAKYDVTDYGYGTSYGSTGNGMFSVADGVLKASFVPNGSSNYSSGTIVLKKDGAPVEFTPNKTYTISFKYKWDKAPADGTPWIVVANGANYGSVSNWTGVSGDSSIMSDAGNYTYTTSSSAANHRNKNRISGFSSEWRTYTKEFTTYDVASADIKNYICLTICTGKNHSILIDDIAVVDNSKANLVNINTNCDTTYSAIIAAIGSQVSLPTGLVNGDIPFNGWYFDGSFEHPVPVVEGGYKFIMPDYNVNVYAKWGEPAPSYVIDFESGYPEDKTNVNGASTFGGAFYLHKSGQLSHGKSVNFDPKYCHSGLASLMIDLTGMKTNTSALLRNSANLDGYIAKPGETYHITFWYRVADGHNAAGTTLAIYTHTSPISGWYALTRYDNGSYTFQDVTGDAGWCKAVVSYTNTTDKNQYMHLRLDATGKTDADAKIYIDDIEMRKLEAGETIVTMISNNGSETVYSVGKTGESFRAVVPVLTDSEYYTFKGWYTDDKCTVAYRGNYTHQSSNLTLYAKWQFKAGISINESFEDYKGSLPGTCLVTSADKASGNKSMRFELGSDHNQSNIQIYLGDTPFSVSNGQRFAVSFKYKLDNPPIDSSNQLSMSFYTSNNVQQTFWYNKNRSAQAGIRWWIRTNTLINEWLIFSDVVTIEKINGNSLYFVLSQGPSVCGYIDDITLTPLADDEVAICAATEVASSVAPYYIGKKGTSYVLPSNATRSGPGYTLGGWYTDEKFVNPTTVTGVYKEDTKLFVQWILTNISQGFESYKGYSGYYMMSSDWELYNSSVKGFDSANVKVGRASLHRIGNNHLWQNAQLLSRETQLAAGKRYTLSFWVKMDKSLHTDGTIRIASCNSEAYEYDIGGKYFNVVAISELADNQWHKITYTFDAAGLYFVFSTPGYCSLYFDDVNIKLTPSAELSESVKADKEYEPVRRLADGTLVDDEKIVDPSLLAMLDPDKTTDVETHTKNGVIEMLESLNPAVLVLIIAGIVLVLAAAVTVPVIIIRKNKTKKSGQPPHNA